METILRLPTQDVEMILTALESYETILAEERDKRGLPVIKVMIDTTIKDLSRVRYDIRGQL